MYVRHRYWTKWPDTHRYQLKLNTISLRTIKRSLIKGGMAPDSFTSTHPVSLGMTTHKRNGCHTHNYAHSIVYRGTPLFHNITCFLVSYFFVLKILSSTCKIRPKQHSKIILFAENKHWIGCLVSANMGFHNWLISKISYWYIAILFI